MANCRWTVEISVADVWVVDGFRLTAEKLQGAIEERLLPFAFEREVTVNVINAPTEKKIAAVQARWDRAQEGVG